MPGSLDSRNSQIRLYCSICYPSYNERTHQLFIEDPNLQVLVATDSLKVDNDFPNVADVVVLFHIIEYILSGASSVGHTLAWAAASLHNSISSAFSASHDRFGSEGAAAAADGIFVQDFFSVSNQSRSGVREAYAEVSNDNQVQYQGQHTIRASLSDVSTCASLLLLLLEGFLNGGLLIA